MAYTFPNQAAEWGEAYREVLNDSEEYAQAGAEWGVDFDGSFLFEIRPADSYDGEPVYMYLGLVDGTCHEVRIVDSPETIDYGFALRADFSAWRDLIGGSLNPIEAILSGPFDLEGDRVKVMQWSSAGVTMAELASEVETEFPET